MNESRTAEEWAQYAAEAWGWTVEERNGVTETITDAMTQARRDALEEAVAKLRNEVTVSTYAPRESLCFGLAAAIVEALARLNQTETTNESLKKQVLIQEQPCKQCGGSGEYVEPGGRGTGAFPMACPTCLHVQECITVLASAVCEHEREVFDSDYAFCLLCGARL